MIFNIDVIITSTKILEKFNFALNENNIRQKLPTKLYRKKSLECTESRQRVKITASDLCDNKCDFL